MRDDKKSAAILLNLGGPWSLGEVRGFLFRLFADRAILDLPLPLRLPLAALIAFVRAGGAKKRYGEIGGRSPLLAQSEAQARALEKFCRQKGADVKFFIAMRYNRPGAKEAIVAAKKWGAAELLFVPLYPHYSTTTSESSLKQAALLARKLAPELPARALCCYPQADFYIQTCAALLRATLARAPGAVRTLFSAHGIPQKRVAAGDPYRAQIEATAAATAQAAGLAEEDWRLCFQSKVGPLAWTGPSLDQEIANAARDKIGLAVLPVSFVSEHIETLHELDIEYRALALRQAVPFWLRVPALGVEKGFIDGLGAAVLDLRRGKEAFICPESAPGSPCAAEEFFRN